MVTTLIAILITWYIGQTSKDIMTGEMIPTIRTLSPVVVLLTMVSMCMLMKTFIRCCIYHIDFRHNVHCMNLFYYLQKFIASDSREKN